MKKIFVLLIIACFFITTSLAKSTITSVNIYSYDNRLFINVAANIEVTHNIIKYINNSIKLNVSYQFKIKSRKWYKIFASSVIEKKYIIYYNKIISQYIVEDPILYTKKQYATIEDAFKSIERLANFPLVLSNLIDADNDYLLVRFFLKSKNLPISIKIEHFFNNDRNISSDWSAWSFPSIKK